MSSFKLYTYANNYRAWKALIAAQYAQITIEVPAFEFGKDNKTECFKAKNPLGKVPVLETQHGTIFESNAIARYVARVRPDVGLYGGSVFQAGQVDQWLDFSTNELEPPRGVWIYPILGYLAFNPKAYAEAKKDVANALSVLNSHLEHHTFLVGHQVTVADIVIVSALVELYRQVFAPDFIKPFVNVTRWFTTCINQPEFVKIIGKVDFAKEEAKAPQAGKADKKEKPKEDKPKEAAKKEDKPKKPAKEAEDDGGDLDDEEHKPKKTKSALDLLPPSPMVLDTVKRTAYAERPIALSFFPWLWENFDAAGWSWWTCHYKYDDENTVMFRTSNLVSGFIQRCDSVRKYSMGVLNMIGNADEETPPFKVLGCFMFRGLEIPKVEMLEENPDSEYYTWTKIDVSSDAGKQLIRDLYTADTIHGQKVLERKMFK